MNDLKEKLNTLIPLHYSTSSRKSSVAIIIMKNKNEHIIYLTKRSKKLSSHPGEISFPGGTYDSQDKNLFNTCTREVMEELNISLTESDCIGQLNDVWTLTGFHIRPFVFYKESIATYKQNSDEIDEVLHIPFTFFEQNMSHQLKYYKNRQWNSYSCIYENNLIWGATASILNSLVSL